MANQKSWPNFSIKLSNPLIKSLHINLFDCVYESTQAIDMPIQNNSDLIRQLVNFVVHLDWFIKKKLTFFACPRLIKYDTYEENCSKNLLSHVRVLGQ